jgi:2-alkenal reductase
MGVSFAGRRWLGAAAVTALLVILAACGNGATADTSAASTASQDVREPVPAAVGDTAEATSVSVAGNSAVATVGARPVENSSAPAGEVAIAKSEDVQGLKDAEVSAPALVQLDANAIVAANEEVLSGIYERVVPGVVHIRVRQRVQSPTSGRDFGLPPGFDQQFPGRPSEPFSEGEGSGFVWSADGYIVTNQHVIENADRVTVTFADGLELDATVLGSDADSDLAVLKVDVPASGLTAVELGDSDKVRVGQLVAAIGNPFGQEFTLTTGIVSALGRTIQGNSRFSIPQVIQTDAAINPGNSGGPLLDRLGRVVAINSQIVSRSGASAGVGFALPINFAKRVVPVLIERGRYDYSFLGMTGASLDRNLAKAMELPDGTRGALVIGLAEGGPADVAGLVAVSGTREVEGIEVPLDGDVIVAIDGVAVRDMSDLIIYLNRSTQPGDRVSLDVVRIGGESDQVEVNLGTRPHETG